MICGLFPPGSDGLGTEAGLWTSSWPEILFEWETKLPGKCSRFSLERELTQINTGSGQQRWELEDDSPTSEIPGSAGFCVLALLYQVVAEACFFPNEISSHNVPFYLLTSIPGQATLCFELIHYFFFCGGCKFPDMPEMKHASQSTVFSLAVYPLLCRLLALWRLPVGLIW